MVTLVNLCWISLTIGAYLAGEYGIDCTILLGIEHIVTRTMLGSYSGRGTTWGMYLTLIIFVGLLRFNELYLGVIL
jgi:hypothetical protein